VAKGGRRQKGIGMDTSIIQVAGNQAELWAEITPMAPFICMLLWGSKNVAYSQAPRRPKTFSTFFVVVIKVFIALNENFSLPPSEFSHFLPAFLLLFSLYVYYCTAWRCFFVFFAVVQHFHLVGVAHWCLCLCLQL